jgi:hypothetical protein
VEVSSSLISEITDGVIEQARAWQNRPLEPFYAVVFLDALYVKMRYEGRVGNRAVPVEKNYRPPARAGALCLTILGIGVAPGIGVEPRKKGVSGSPSQTKGI